MHLNFDWRLTIILWGWHISVWFGGWHTFQFGLEADTFTSGQGADNHSVRLTISIWTGCNLYQSLQTVSNWLGLNHGSVWNPTIFIRLLSIPWLLWQILLQDWWKLSFTWSIWTLWLCSDQWNHLSWWCPWATITITKFENVNFSRAIGAPAKTRYSGHSLSLLWESWWLLHPSV